MLISLSNYQTHPITSHPFLQLWFCFWCDYCHKLFLIFTSELPVEKGHCKSCGCDPRTSAVRLQSARGSITRSCSEHFEGHLSWEESVAVSHGTCDEGVYSCHWVAILTFLGREKFSHATVWWVPILEGLWILVV